MIRLRIEGFLDGARVERELTEPSRWEIQEAKTVKVDIGGDFSVDLLQRPRLLSSSKVGVGAVLWDGGIVLTALLASLPPSSLFGEVLVELGAGVGAPSIAAAKRGARVVSTDREAAVTGVLRHNVGELNGVLSPSFRLPPEAGKVALRVLEFGTPGGDAEARALAEAAAAAAADAADDERGGSGGGGGVDLVLAADCVYSDGDGESPDPEDLCRTAASLLTRRRRRRKEGKGGGGGGGGGGGDDEGEFLPPPSSSARFWLASEERDAETHALFVKAAARHFASVRRLQLPAALLENGGSRKKASRGRGNYPGGGESPWAHVRVFELAGAGCGTESGRVLSAAEMRALKKPRKRGWP